MTNGVAPSITVDTTTQWWTHTYSSQPSFTPQDYYIGIVPNGQARCYYDTVTGGGNIGGSGNSYATPTTFGATGVADRQFSAYVTYTLAGAFTRNTFLRQAVNRASTY